jgi:hypothetical protein
MLLGKKQNVALQGAMPPPNLFLSKLLPCKLFPLFRWDAVSPLLYSKFVLWVVFLIFFCGLFYDSLYTDYKALNGRITDEWGHRGITEVKSQEFTWNDWRIWQNTSVRIAHVMVKIWIQHPQPTPKMSQEQYHYNSLHVSLASGGISDCEAYLPYSSFT